MASKRNKDQGEPVPSYLKEDGYLYVMLTDEGGRRHEHAVHILVAETFLGPARLQRIGSSTRTGS